MYRRSHELKQASKHVCTHVVLTSQAARRWTVRCLLCTFQECKWRQGVPLLLNTPKSRTLTGKRSIEQNSKKKRHEEEIVAEVKWRGGRLVDTLEES